VLLVLELESSFLGRGGNIYLEGSCRIDNPFFGVARAIFMGYLYVWYNMCWGLIEIFKRDSFN
jgi:hypothetical protein